MRLLQPSFLLCLLGLFAGCAETPVVRNVPARYLPGRIIARGVVGQVTALVEGTGEKTTLQNNTELRQGMVVTTGPDASVTLIFGNATIATVAPKSELLIETFTQIPSSATLIPDETTTEPSSSVTKLTLLHGGISGRVPRLNTDRGSSLTIRSGTEEKQFNGTNFKVSAP